MSSSVFDKEVGSSIESQHPADNGILVKAPLMAHSLLRDRAVADSRTCNITWNYPLNESNSDLTGDYYVTVPKKEFEIAFTCSYIVYMQDGEVKTRELLD
jgi:hypothetical protein